MQWHLIAPSGQVHRSCEAETVHEARLRFRLSGCTIVGEWCVVSAASWDVSKTVRIPDPDRPMRELLTDPKTRAARLKAARQARWREKLTPEEYRAYLDKHNARRRKAG